jgi:hypothetical protein
MKKIEVIDIRTHENNETSMTVRLDEDFKAWFLEISNLKRWSLSRFQKEFARAMKQNNSLMNIIKIKVIFIDK